MTRAGTRPSDQIKSNLSVDIKQSVTCSYCAWPCRCVVSDTAEYSAVATNQHGTATSKAKVTVKSKPLPFSKTLFACHMFLCKHKSKFLVPPRTSRSRGVLPARSRWEHKALLGSVPIEVSGSGTTSWNHETWNSSIMRGLIRSGNFDGEAVPVLWLSQEQQT